ncbi:MAG: metal-dependent transcriptional regulator [Endomicrobium sp.]|jgi:DtxR family Mn-dependent transcriptional regulator|nr:metal-dependent transcriptional regulator [Endomicrobium sp.]
MVKFKRKELPNNLSASLENYLETIAVLKKEKRYARIGDIAKSLDVKSSSVNGAINFLIKNDLVTHEKYGYVDLTDRGEKIASEVQKKHDVLYRFLHNLLFINNETANKEACKIEHLISVETTRKLEMLHSVLEEHFLEKDGERVNLKECLNKCDKQR